MASSPEPKIEENQQIDIANLFSPQEIFSKYPHVEVKIEVTPQNFSGAVWRKAFPALPLQGAMNGSLQNFQIASRIVKQKYKRSTNNSHKKFISTARKLLFANLEQTKRERFQKHYGRYRSCRSYFFIVLAYVRYKLTEEQIRQFLEDFEAQMTWKIKQYQKEVEKTVDQNLRNFRSDEISDIQYSIEGCKAYLFKSTEQGIEWMYRRSRSDVIKKQHYNGALRMILNIEKKIEKDSDCEDNVLLEEEQENIPQDEIDQSDKIKNEIEDSANLLLIDPNVDEKWQQIISPLLITSDNKLKPLFPVNPEFSLKKPIKFMI